jgi:hypothetical protein
VTSNDWQTYKTLSLGIQVPLIESVLINRHGTEVTGAGETAITPVAAWLDCQSFTTGVREEIEIGAIEDTILILDEKRARLSEASTSGSAFSRCIAVSMAKFGYLSKCLAMLSRSRSMLPRWTLISA